MANTQTQPFVNYAGQDVFLEEFTDHAGMTVIRYGIRDHDSGSDEDDMHDQDSDESEDDKSWPPTDYRYDPYFCFQVYITIDLKLDEATCETLTQHLTNLKDVQLFKPPIWEFYVANRAVLDCVDRSRREIAHRKLDEASLLIYPLCHSSYDERRLGFAFIIDDEHGWRTNLRTDMSECACFPNKTGPLWAHFDPRIPAKVIDIDQTWLQIDDGEVPTLDQVDVLITRIQGPEADTEIRSMYQSGLTEMLYDEHEDDDDVEHSQVTKSSDADTLIESTKAMRITTDRGIAIANTDQEPDMRYVVCVTFTTELEDIARRFAASIANLTDKSFSLYFYHAVSDSAALAACPQADVGVLTHAFAKRAHWDELGTYRSSPGMRRLHPINHSPQMVFQDPATSENPFKTCILVIDRPDFVSTPATRFLLASGEPQHYVNNNYLEMQSWRSSSMQAVVDKLTLECKEPELRD